MKLIIDVGNTLVKVAVFENKTLQLKKIFIKKDFLDVLKDVAEKFPSINQCIVSTVGNLSEHQYKILRNYYATLELSHTTKVPFINNYSTPTTLGVDRIALVSAAAVQYPRKNVLIIDAGTCITYDFITEENKYQGGAISSGISMRYNALHTFTAKLPLLDASVPKMLVGNSTASSIHSGILNGVLFEIDGFIEAYKIKYSDLTVILTGGDAHFLRDRLKNDIFANSNFLLEGLLYILEHNNT
ncbi:type III pantothenate kinase [Cochleicola gelatinilyticus]|uniref:Type III pantothenate kinase n=1 Tax=Cochleicola gelatinilyticus TaxID=1763537 RepID=A0A167IMA4_9FLAO|nr:type III pantothenate kinase [Cochleicola gelatinilyticus]OAB79820.1 type III pantothenate kinase [Cochleicola gelatinilyticus]